MTYVDIFIERNHERYVVDREVEVNKVPTYVEVLSSLKRKGLIKFEGIIILWLKN